MAALSATLPRGTTLLPYLARLGGFSIAIAAAFAIAYKPTYFLWHAYVPWVIDTYQDVAIGASDVGLALIAACGWRGRPLPAPARALKIAGTVLLVCLTASVFVSGAWLLSFAALVRCALGLFAALAIVRRPGLIPWLLLGGVLALVAQIPFVEIQLITQSSMPSGRLFDGALDEIPAAAAGAVAVIGPDGTRWQRAVGTFPHPNILGGALAVALVFAFHKLLRGGRPSWHVVALWALGWLMLFVTFSRSAWLATFLGCALLLLGERAFRHRSVVLLVVAPLVALALATLVFGSALTNRLSIGQSLFDSPAVRERDLIADIAWAMIRAHPIAGVGAGNFTLAELEPPYYAASVEPAHLVPLLVAAEAGVLAGLAWLALLVAPLAVEWFQAQRITITRLAIPATLLILALLDHYLWTFGPGRALFWLTLGIWVAGESFEGSKVGIVERSFLTGPTPAPEPSSFRAFEPANTERA